jgi:hypothetical protein
VTGSFEYGDELLCSGATELVCVCVRKCVRTYVCMYVCIYTVYLTTRSQYLRL